MTDKTQNEIDHERAELIDSLGPDDFSMLSPAQFQMAQRAQLETRNKRASARVGELLDDKVKDVARALTESPFVYKTDDVQVIAGCKVRFTTLITAQVRDAHRRLDEFMVREDPNNLRSGDFLNRELLAHAIFSYNGQDFGGVDFDPAAYQGLQSSDPKQAQDMLDEVRNHRIQAIDNLSPHVVDRLIEYYQAFQLKIEELVHSEEMNEAVGN